MFKVNKTACSKFKKKVTILKCKGRREAAFFTVVLPVLKIIRNSKYFFHSPKCRFSSKKRKNVFMLHIHRKTRKMQGYNFK